MDIVYRTSTATPDDICAHLTECSPYFSPPLNEKVDLEIYSQKLYNSAINFEAWLDSKLIGLVAAYFNDLEKRVGFISNVSVAPGLNGRGLGYNLVSNAIEYARRMSFKNISLEVSIDNQTAIRLYRKLGFSEIEVSEGIQKMKIEI